jgi:cob(I)alamin adenosyltransferase
MRGRLKKGLIQIYTGSGKGKTTAALGLALRASGAGMKVYIQQFIKNAAYSEIRAIAGIRNIKIEQCGRGCFIKGKPKQRDIDRAKRGLDRSAKAIYSGKYDLAILDEINVALRAGLVSKEDVGKLVIGKPRSVELVLTGRYCPPGILKLADLITEMKNVRHPFNKGIPARLGIEY